MNKKYFDTRKDSLEDKINTIASEQAAISKPVSDVKLSVEKKYFESKKGSLEDVASKLVESKLDPVNKDAVKKKFDNRQDKDIDNDGDTDSTDKYLHTRRSAISKNIKETEGTSGGGIYALRAIRDKKERQQDELKDLDKKDPNYKQKADALKKQIENQKEIMKRKQREVFDSYDPSLKEDDMAKFHQMQKDGKSADEIAKALGLDVKSVKKLMDLDEVRNPYAVGMAQAMKAKNDEPPLKKSTITKAHDIAKSIMKKEEVCPKCGKDHANKINASNCMGESKKTFSDLRTETKVIKLGDKGKTATGKEAGAVDVEPRAIPV